MRVKKYALWSTILLVFVCIGLSFFGCGTSPVPNATPAPVAQFSGDAELAKFIESIRVEEGLPALTAAIIVDGKIYSVAAVGTRKFGTDNWVTVNDKFLIGSCAKAFTATLAAILIEEGRLNWQTTIRDVFPDLKMLPEYETITIQQLLSHRAGLPKNLKEGKATWLINYGFDEKRGTTPRILRLQYLEQTVQNKLINPPGKVVYYSNSGYILAGAMLEAIAKQPYEKLRAEKIFRPLDITTAGYGIPADSEPMSQPWGYYWDKSKKSFVAYSTDYPNFMAPTGYMYLSVEDWAKFLQVHLDSYPSKKRKLLQPITLKMLHTPPDTARWEINIGYNTNYALGWFTKKADDGHHLLWHGGRGFAFNAQVIADLKTKNTILLVTNSEVSHIHPQYHLLIMVKKIQEHYAGKVNLPALN
jgi:CubicO group peptidase (beta-lactamase class C family)